MALVPRTGNGYAKTVEFGHGCRGRRPGFCAAWSRV